MHTRKPHNQTMSMRDYAAQPFFMRATHTCYAKFLFGCIVRREARQEKSSTHTHTHKIAQKLTSSIIYTERKMYPLNNRARRHTAHIQHIRYERVDCAVDSFANTISISIRFAGDGIESIFRFMISTKSKSIRSGPE